MSWVVQLIYTYVATQWQAHHVHMINITMAYVVFPIPTEPTRTALSASCLWYAAHPHQLSHTSTLASHKYLPVSAPSVNIITRRRSEYFPACGKRPFSLQLPIMTIPFQLSHSSYKNVLVSSPSDKHRYGYPSRDSECLPACGKWSYS